MYTNEILSFNCVACKMKCIYIYYGKSLTFIMTKAFSTQIKRSDCQVDRRGNDDRCSVGRFEWHGLAHTCERFEIRQQIRIIPGCLHVVVDLTSRKEMNPLSILSKRVYLASLHWWVDGKIMTKKVFRAQNERMMTRTVQEGQRVDGLCLRLCFGLISRLWRNPAYAQPKNT